MAGYQNVGDNEITGIHMSNGDPTPPSPRRSPAAGARSGPSSTVTT